MNLQQKRDELKARNDQLSKQSAERWQKKREEEEAKQRAKLPDDIKSSLKAQIERLERQIQEQEQNYDFKKKHIAAHFWRGREPKDMKVRLPEGVDWTDDEKDMMSVLFACGRWTTEVAEECAKNLGELSEEHREFLLFSTLTSLVAHDVKDAAQVVGDARLAAATRLKTIMPAYARAACRALSKSCDQDLVGKNAALDRLIRITEDTFDPAKAGALTPDTVFSPIGVVPGTYYPGD